MPLSNGQLQVLLTLQRKVQDLVESVSAGNRSDHYAPAKADAASLDTTVNNIVTFLSGLPD